MRGEMCTLLQLGKVCGNEAWRRRQQQQQQRRRQTCVASGGSNRTQRNSSAVAKMSNRPTRDCV